MTALPSSRPLLGAKPQLWVPGDWNAFFGFGTNILVNLLTLTGLLRFVLQMPADMVFKRILPAARWCDHTANSRTATEARSTGSAIQRKACSSRSMPAFIAGSARTSPTSRSSE